MFDRSVPFLSEPQKHSFHEKLVYNPSERYNNGDVAAPTFYSDDGRSVFPCSAY